MKTMNNKYRISRTEAVKECTESKANIKSQLKMEKIKLNDFIDLVATIEIDWKERNAIIGQMYMNIAALKLSLKEHGRKKKNVKK